MLRQLPTRKDDEGDARDDEASAACGDEGSKEPARERGRHSQLQANAGKERHAKDDLEDLPPTLVCSIR